LDSAKTIRLGVEGSLPKPVELALEAAHIEVVSLAAQPAAAVDVVLVVELPSPALGRFRGRSPILVALDDPSAGDVSRMLRSGAADWIGRPLHPAELVRKVRRLAP
jgi:DNA-binding response OmpR family regulator